MTTEPNTAAKKAEKIVAVKGMNDILPPSVPRTERLPDSALWQWFESVVRRDFRLVSAAIAFARR